MSGEVSDLAPTTRTPFAGLHADAVAVLSRWTAPDAGQEALRRVYLDHLAAHPDGVAKVGPTVHLTASCLVVDAARERVLLTLHRRAREWFQFGGHLESDDASLWAAARREVREESGLVSLEPLPRPIQLDRHVLGDGFGRCHEHLDVRYVAVAPEGAAGIVSEESLDVRWWPVDGLPPGTRNELTPLVSAALSALASG